jgi:hypothetical protein
MTTALSSQLPLDSSLAQHLQIMIFGVAQTSMRHCQLVCDSIEPLTSMAYPPPASAIAMSKSCSLSAGSS